MYREKEINFLSVTPRPKKWGKNIMSLLYVSEHSKHFLKPVKKLGSGWPPTHPIGTNSQIWPFFLRLPLFKLTVMTKVCWVGQNCLKLSLLTLIDTWLHVPWHTLRKSRHFGELFFTVMVLIICWKHMSTCSVSSTGLALRIIDILYCSWDFCVSSLWQSQRP